MKALLIVGLCLAALLAAGSAHAYAIYNHTDYWVCVTNQAAFAFQDCNFRISPHSTHNGAHGSGLKNHAMAWQNSKACRRTDFFDIPDGGYARIYNDLVKVYKHDGKLLEEREVYNMDCSGAGAEKNKP